MNAVTALISDKNGYPVKRAKIRATYSSSFMGGTTELVYSDSTGRALITWGDNPKFLKSIHVNGKTFKNKYVNSSTHTFTI